MKSPEITLDEKHVYRVAMGDKLKEVPSVTTIMKDVGYYPWVFKEKDDVNEIDFPDEEITPAERGTAVHKITEDLDRGIEVEPIAKELVPYIEAYRKFKRDNKITITQIEEIVFCKQFWYAGALDRVMKIKNVIAIVDIKTGTQLKVTGIQLAAYKYAWEKMGGQKNLNRFALHLKENATYKLVPYRSREDLPDFLAAVRVFNRKRQT